MPPLRRIRFPERPLLTLLRTLSGPQAVLGVLFGGPLCKSPRMPAKNQRLTAGTRVNHTLPRADWISLSCLATADKKEQVDHMTHLFSRFRIRALGVAARLLPAPTPFMLTGPGSSIQLARLIADCGARSVLVVTDKVLVELGVVAPVLNALQEAGLSVTVFSEVEPDPTIAIVMAGIEQLRASGATAVLAVGGGSPIDAAKAMIACHASGRRTQDLDGYFKVRAPVLPFFAVPTTAGSGSEVTVASVVSDPAAGRKFAIVDNKLVPAAIALDPKLMVGLPSQVTAATGLDALTHAIESNLSTLATPATRALSVASARAIFRDLPGLARTVATSPPGRALLSRRALLASPSPGRASATSTPSPTSSARSTTARTAT